jgi:peptide/nickel transport system substrate-binding protein
LPACVSTSGGTSATPSSSAACTRGGTLTMATQNDASSLVPWDSSGSMEPAQMLIYDQLVEQLPGYKDPQPGLAQSWDISPDSLAFTFHLRDARFSNGDPVTAEDVKFSLDRMIDPKVDVNWAFLMGNIKNFVLVDSKTIQMNMTSVDASVIWTLTMPGGSIYSKKVFNALGEKGFAKAPVGSGAFMVKSWTIGQSFDVVRNPNYWRTGQPYLDGVNVVVVSNANARTLKVLSGEADVAVAIPFNQVAQVKAANNLMVVVLPKMVGWNVILNNTVKPFDEQVVREALNYAAPKQQINVSVLAGLGTISNSMIAQNGVFWDPTVAPIPYDLAKAKQLLSQSSVPKGFSFELIIGNSSVQSEQAAEILQQAWAQIGVTMTITKLDGGVFYDRLMKLNYQANMNGPGDISSDSPDDNEYAEIFFDYSDAWKSWFSGYKSAQASSLVKAANATVDVTKRRQLYSQLQKLEMHDTPWVPLLNAPEVDAVSNKVMGWNAVVTSWSRLEDVCFGR